MGQSDVPPAPERLSPVILIVESSSVRNLIGAVLQKEHYQVLLEDIAGGQEVLRSSPVDVLITNEPWWFEPFVPGLRVLYVSGAPDREFLQKYEPDTVAFLQKPFRFQNLLLSVHLLLQYAAKDAHPEQGCA